MKGGDYPWKGLTVGSSCSILSSPTQQLRKTKPFHVPQGPPCLFLSCLGLTPLQRASLGIIWSLQGELWKPFFL